MRIFLSYCHKNRVIADHIDQIFQKANYTIVRDIREVDFKGDLHKYCNRIRECQAAICLISDDYLKSRWCMYEILQLMKERQFAKKIFPVVMDDADIFIAKNRLKYVKYWNKEYDELNSGVKNLKPYQTSEAAVELKLLLYIGAEINTFTTILAGWLLPKYDTLEKTGFKEILHALPESSYQQLINLMTERIRVDLDNKLLGTEYIPMELEYGIIPGSRIREDIEKPDQLIHGRKWQRFNLRELIPLKKKYVLSSSVGMGKTTFVYHLSGQLLGSGYLPLVFSCQEFEKINPDTVFRLLNYFTDIYADHSAGKLKQDVIQDIFESHREKIVFLFDGLDQILSDKHAHLASLIEKVCSNYPLLITSRPSAVNFFESRRDYVFLRLRLFSQAALATFFGGKFPKARELITFALDLIRTPMLAYLMKKLMEEGMEEDIQTKTELYQAFVKYILREQNREEYKPTTARNVILNLQKISYTAMALENPQIQKISLDHCYKQLENITCENLTAYGLVNLALEKSEFFYFTHQSFQEYFAACYVKENQEYVDVIIKQQWQPKWKEVIKFLAGLMGTEFVEKIVRGEDNVIHSRIFLGVECMAEIKEKDARFIKYLQGELNRIPYEEPFQKEIIRGHIILGNIDYILRLLHHKENLTRNLAIITLGEIGNLPESIIVELGEILRDPDNSFRADTAITLGNSGNLPEPIIRQIVELLRNPSDYLRAGAVEALENIGNLPESVIIEMGEILRSQDSSVHTDTAAALGNINNLPESIINQLEELLHDSDSEVRRNAINALKNSNNLPESIIVQLEKLLHDPDSEVRKNAGIVLGNSGNLSESIIVQLGELLHSEDISVCVDVIDTLGEIGSLPEFIISQLAELLRDPHSDVRKSAINTLGNSGNLPESIIGQLVELLYDFDLEVRNSVTDALEKIDSLPESIIHQLGELLHDPDVEVRIRAVFTLGNSSNLPESIISELEKLLHDPYSGVRWRAAAALGKIRNLPESIIRKLGELLHDQDIHVCGVAASVLGNIGNLPESIIHQLGELLRDPDNTTRCRVMEALKNYDNLPESIISELVKLLHDPNSAFPWRAAAVLKNLYEKGGNIYGKEKDITQK